MNKRKCYNQKCDALEEIGDMYAVVVPSPTDSLMTVGDERAAACQTCYESNYYKGTPTDFVKGDLVRIQIPLKRRGDPTNHGKNGHVISFNGDRWTVNVVGVGEKTFLGIHMRVLIAHCNCDPSKMWFGNGCECGAAKRERAAKALLVRD